MKYHAAISFIAPYRIYLPDEFFNILVGGSFIRVKALPIPLVNATSVAQGQGEDFEVSHDIFGFAGRTKFYVVLDDFVEISNPDWRQEICTRDHALVASAINAVNRMIAVYRDIDINRIGVSSFHVIELVKDDLSDISLVVVDEELNQVSDFEVRWPGYRTMGFGDGLTRDAHVVNTIRACLSSGTEIPIERELISSAWNHHRRRQLRFVPVEMNTAFESYAFSVLKRVAPSKIYPDSIDMLNKLHNLNSEFAKIAAVKSRNFTRWFNPAIRGWRGLLSPELKQWHSGCYELRNLIIHRGYNSVTLVQAEAAIKNTLDAINMVEQCITALIS